MPSTVYKYELNRTGLTTVVLPVSAEILTVACQGQSLCMWAKIDTLYLGIDVHTRVFESFYTGHEIPYNMGIDYDYVGTAFTECGLVLHVFEQLT